MKETKNLYLSPAVAVVELQQNEIICQSGSQGSQSTPLLETDDQTFTF